MRVTEHPPIRTGLLPLLLLAALGGCAATAPPSEPAPALAPDTPAGVPQWWVMRVFGYRPLLLQERRLPRF